MSLHPSKRWALARSLPQPGQQLKDVQKSSSVRSGRILVEDSPSNASSLKSILRLPKFCIALLVLLMFSACAFHFLVMSNERSKGIFLLSGPPSTAKHALYSIHKHVRLVSQNFSDLLLGFYPDLELQQKQLLKVGQTALVPPQRLDPKKVANAEINKGRSSSGVDDRSARNLRDGISFWPSRLFSNIFGMPKLMKSRAMKEADYGGERFNTEQALDQLHIDVFCAPLLPITKDVNDRQRLALSSWLALSRNLSVVLVGKSSKLELGAVANSFARRVMVETEVDTDFHGLPLFHSLISRAQASTSDVSIVLADCGIAALGDILLSIVKVDSIFTSWMITSLPFEVQGLHSSDIWQQIETDVLAGRRDSSKNSTTEDRIDSSSSSSSTSDKSSSGIGSSAKADRESRWKLWRTSKVRRLIRENGILATQGRVHLWAWNNFKQGGVSLLPLPVPPFSMAGRLFDNWFMHEVIAGLVRQVVDVTEVSTLFVLAAFPGRQSEAEVSRLLDVDDVKQAHAVNERLAAGHGSYRELQGTAIHSPWKLGACDEPAVDNICLNRRLRPGTCTCEHSMSTSSSSSDMWLDEKRYWRCGRLAPTFSPDAAAHEKKRPASLLWQSDDKVLPLPRLLEKVAKVIHGPDGKRLHVVTLVAVSYGYVDHLMNFVCQLKAMDLDKNLLVAALDEEVFHFALTQGLAVYYEADSRRMVGYAGVNNAEDCEYGSSCFKKLTKLKSRTVLRILKYKVSVLWSDVDIVWFEDPLPYLLSFGRGTLPIQSNEPNASLPGNGIRRINSGFYFARSEPKVVSAFGAITRHAAETDLSEQPSFYAVLCGEEGQLRKEATAGGLDECRWQNGLRTIFLDRSAFPNGAVHGLWEQEDVRAACREQGCSILHNNWLSGARAKRGRAERAGFWRYDDANRMCSHSWSRKHSSDPP